AGRARGRCGRACARPPPAGASSTACRCGRGPRASWPGSRAGGRRRVPGLAQGPDRAAWVHPRFHGRFDQGLKLPVTPGNSTTHSRVVEPLEVAEDIGPGLIAGAVAGAVSPLALDDPEETLAGRVVAAVADRAHAADQGVASEELLVSVADELPAAVGMQDHL